MRPHLRYGPHVSVISLRRNVTVGVALGMLLVPGCHAADTSMPYAEAIQFAPEDLGGLNTRTVSVESEDSTVSYSYPILGESHPLSAYVRTAMAERQTAFLENLPDRGDPELVQTTSLLAASDDVVGVRMSVTDSTKASDRPGSSTLWYDARTEQVMPWTSLFHDEQALAQAHLALADVLREDYDMAPEQLPGLVGEVSAKAEESDGELVPAAASDPATDPEEGEGTGEGELPLGDADLTDPEQAMEAAERWSASPLADLAFSTAGGLAVRMDPAQIPGTGRAEEALIPIEAEETEESLSELGYRARDAAVNGNSVPAERVAETTGDTEGRTLDCAEAKCVALTFDDGPGEYTEELLDTLAEYDAQATFYVLGSLVEEFPEIAERTAAKGHEVGSHTWKHDDLTSLSGDGVREDMERTSEAIEKATGKAPRTMRPPYGSHNSTVSDALGQPIILWDVDTMDWQSRDTDAIIDHAVSEVDTGSVVLFHDIHKSTVDAIPDILKELHSQGYHFVSVENLFADGQLSEGEAYTDARLE